MDDVNIYSVPPTLKQRSLHIIERNFDFLLDAFANESLPSKYYEHLQRTSSHELLKKLNGRIDLETKHVDFFFNQYIHELDLDVFSPSETPNILNKLVIIGENITSFSLTRFVYPKYVLLQLISLLPNLQSLCLDKTRCSNKVLKSIAETCPLLKRLDISECLDVSDAGIRSLCKEDGRGNYFKNFMLEELDIWSTDVSIEGVVFAIRYFPNMTKLNHYLLCTALFEMHLSPNRANRETTTYNLKELKIHRVNGFNEEILTVYNSLCPQLISLQLYGLDLQTEIDACKMFENLTEVGFFNTPQLLPGFSPTSFLQCRGQNLTKLEIGFCVFSLQSLSEYCPNLQHLYLQCCEMEDLEYVLANPEHFSLSNVKTLIFDDMSNAVEDTIRLVIMTCPNLVQLTMWYINNIDSVISDVSHFQCAMSLRIVEFVCVRVNMCLILNLLKKAPHVQKIIFKNCNMSNSSQFDLNSIVKHVALRYPNVRFICKNELLVTASDFDSFYSNISKRREIWGYGFDYEDDFEL